MPITTVGQVETEDAVNHSAGYSGPPPSRMPTQLQEKVDLCLLGRSKETTTDEKTFFNINSPMPNAPILVAIARKYLSSLGIHAPRC